MIPATLLLLALAGGCADERPGASPMYETGRREAAIVGGEPEAGWPGVGALALRYDGGQYGGTFCTGTLVAPEWVLTAAHCLAGQEGFVPRARNVLFYVGPNANAGGGGTPAEGRLFAVDALHPHPDYDPQTQSNDIGLVHLAEPVTDVPVYAINTAPVDRGFVGEAVLYVGFGVSDGQRQTGSGVKRSTHLTLVQFASTYYITDYRGSNVCFGDSGGPGLLELDDEWRVIGVVSGGTSEDCLGGYDFSTRVDAYQGWLLGYLTGEPPTCQDYPGMCACDDACLEDGACDDRLCRDFDCASVYDCAAACDAGDEGCASDCWERGTDEGRRLFDELVDCLDAECADAADFQACAYDACGAPIDACFPRVAGEATCAEAYDCMAACGQGGHACFSDCYESGTPGAQAALDAMLGCFQRACASVSDADAWRACVFDACADEIRGCLPASDCDLRGGDCPAGAACVVGFDGESTCVPSRGGKAGDDCGGPEPEAVACGDGLACARVGDASACAVVCDGDDRCDGGAVCDEAGFPDRAALGVCTLASVDCVDEDGDGSCAADDCDDADPAVVPGGRERCNDGVDDDCDGETDEGCTPPTATDAGPAEADGGATGTDSSGPGAVEGDASRPGGADVAGAADPPADVLGADVSSPVGGETGGSGCAAGGGSQPLGPALLVLAAFPLAVRRRRRTAAARGSRGGGV